MSIERSYLCQKPKIDLFQRSWQDKLSPYISLKSTELEVYKDKTDKEKMPTVKSRIKIE